MNPTDTPDWKAFVAEIAARPDDDVPRLVAADWIEEAGDAARAELIRVQCDLAGKPGHNHGGTRLLETCPACRLKARERELLAEHEHRWLAGLPLGLGRGYGHSSRPDDVPLYGIDYWLVKNHATWKRGFLERVRIDWPGWRENGDAILDRHPVEAVTLTGRPDNWHVSHNSAVAWFDGRPDHVVRNLPGYSDRPGGLLLPLLAASWPADRDRPRIKFELPPEEHDRLITSLLPRTRAVQAARQHAELRERVAADALATAQVATHGTPDRLEWLTEPGAPRVLPYRPAPYRYSIYHQCPAEGPVGLRTIALPPSIQDTMFRTLDLALRPYQINEGGYLRSTHYFYAGRCARCSTTFLMEARESDTVPSR